MSTRSADEPTEVRTPVRMRLALSFVGFATGVATVALGWMYAPAPGAVRTVIVLGVAVAAVAAVNGIVVSLGLERTRKPAHRRSHGKSLGGVT